VNTKKTILVQTAGCKACRPQSYSASVKNSEYSEGATGGIQPGYFFFTPSIIRYLLTTESQRQRVPRSDPWAADDATVDTDPVGLSPAMR